MKKLGEKLSADETAFLSANRTKALSEFEKVGNASLGQGTQKAVLSVAGTQVKKAQG